MKKSILQAALEQDKKIALYHVSICPNVTESKQELLTANYSFFLSLVHFFPFVAPPPPSGLSVLLLRKPPVRINLYLHLFRYLYTYTCICVN